MCLTVPCEVVRVDGQTAVVDRAGARFAVSLLFLDEVVRPGDWVAVQAQREARARLSPSEARDILALYEELAALAAQDEAAHG